MPYRNISDLPSSVNIADTDGKKLFMDVVNSQLDSGKSESVAFASAWASLKRAGYEQKDGKWVKKVTVGSVHAGGVLDDLSVFKEDSYELPEAARNNAKKVLRWKEKYGDEVKGMTDVGWNRARQLASNKTVGIETVKAMAQFARHEDNSKVADEHKGEPWKDAGYVAWLGWGGDTGINWARKISESADKINKDGFTLEFNFNKMNEEQRLVYGWASIIEENGQPVIDKQNDVISPIELLKAAHKYLTDYRTAKVMHSGSKKGELVESIVFTNEVQNSLGIDLGKVGWYVAFKIHDDEVWQKVKSGELGMFSIGGRGKRERIQE